MNQIRYDGSVTIAVGESRRSTQWKNKEVLWSQLVERLSIPTKTPETVDEYTNAGGWKASKLRKVLNTEILALLPDDMRAAIKPRVIDGESDLLWLASEMEVFGPHDWTENDPDRGEQMAYYKRRGNRIKALGDEGEAAIGWWERSPNASNTTSFCYVSSSGIADISGAGNSCGVAFGFCV